MATMEKVAAGVWRYAGDIEGGMNVYLVEEEGGVLAFDAGTKRMTKGIQEAAAQFGGVTRVVLGHSHADHRAAAPGLAAAGAPVLCHADERSYAESDGGYGYFDLSRIEVWWSKRLYPLLLRLWDGGPVKISETLAEGDEVAGFRVIHLPGHAPGQIGLWRESDRLALTTDCFYRVDPARLKELPEGSPPIVPHRAFDKDPDLAAESVRKLAALEPEIACPGHAEPLRGSRAEVRAQLEQAADAGAPGRA